MKLFTGAALAAAALAGCGGGGGDKTRTVLGPAGQAELSPTASVAPVTPVPETPTPTPTPKHGKKGTHGKKGKPSATPAVSGTPAVTAAPSVVVPTTTPNPNLVQVKVTITAGAITLDRSRLPAGQGMMFNITGKDVGDKGLAIFRDHDGEIGISRVIPDGTHMETRSLVGKQLVITVKGSPKIKVHRKVIPVG